MVRKTDNYAGWRPRYKGWIDASGYSQHYLAADDPQFPDAAKETLEELNCDGLTFIVPKLGGWDERIIEGTSEPVYLDLLNLECGNATKFKVENFLSKYGPVFRWDPQHPSKNIRWDEYEAAEEMLRLSREQRDVVSKILERGRQASAESPGSSTYILHIDLETRELILEARNINDFIFLQIADVFSRGLTITNCEECGAYMTPSRNTRAYCGDTCRKRAHRDPRHLASHR
jgi:hypothetical protein